MLLAVWVWGAQRAPISSTHQNFVLVILPLGRENKSTELPQKLGGRGAHRVYGGVSVDAGRSGGQC